MLESLARDKHYSLLGPFISHEETKYYWYNSRGHIHNTSFSLILTNRSNELVLHYTRLKRLAKDKHSSLLSSFISYEEMKCC
jgi:hypothetical protein